MIPKKFGHPDYIGLLRTDYVLGKVHVRKMDLRMRLALTRNLLTSIVLGTL
jgi:hypothetical protein